MFHVRQTIRQNFLKPITVKLLPGHGGIHTKTNLNGSKDGLPYSEIPSPSVFSVFKDFSKWGKYRGKPLTDFWEAMYYQYGPIYKIRGMFGKRDSLHLFDPNDFETVYQADGKYPKRNSVPSFVYYRKNCRPDVYKDNLGVASEQGEKWWKNRSVINPVMMKMQTTRRYIPAIDAITSEFVERIHTLRDSNNEVPGDFLFELNKWTLESIAYIMLEKRINGLGNDKTSLMEDTGTILKLTYKFDFSPGFKKSYKTKEGKQLLAAFDRVTEFALKHVRDGKSLYDNQCLGKDSVMGQLLEKDENIATIIALDALFAGVDSTAAAAFHCLYMLATNPEKQNELRHEVMRICANKNTPLSENSLDNIPYLRACIKETFRLSPTVPNQFRATGADIVIKGYHIPNDTDVMMHTMLPSKQEKHFERANEFLPERWIRESTGKPNDSPPYLNIQFGHGVRTCIGRRFAEMELQTLLCRLIRNYHIEWHYPAPQIKFNHIRLPDSELRFRFNKTSE